MPEEPQPPEKKPLDYASGGSLKKKEFSWGRAILLLFLILLGIGLLTFGICTVLIMRS